MDYTIEDYLNAYKCYQAYHFTPDMVCANNRKIIMGSLDISVTTRCTMRCKGCASLTPLYNCGSDQDIDTILYSLDRIIRNVNTILRVNILGGEPFLFEHLDTLCEYLNSQDTLPRVVIMTNGTVISKNKRLLKMLSVPKNEVRISAYTVNTAIQHKLTDMLASNGINYSMKQFNNGHFRWFDFGQLKQYGRSSEELDLQYHNCNVEAQYLHNGRLYVCPRAAHGIELGKIPEHKECFVDLKAESCTDTIICDKINELIFKRIPYLCCDYCCRGTCLVKEIPVAEQMRRR